MPHLHWVKIGESWNRRTAVSRQCSYTCQLPGFSAFEVGVRSALTAQALRSLRNRATLARTAPASEENL